MPTTKNILLITLIQPMTTKLQKQIKVLEDSLTWIENGMMLRSQKQRFQQLMADGQILDAYALIDEYKTPDIGW